MAKSAVQAYCFAIVVVRLGRRFLVVQERKHGQLWYLPAGRLEVGETFEEAAKRETREEAGIDIEIEGILRVEHTPHLSSARFRVIFLARPLDDTPPKSKPDDESLEARWVTLEELSALPLRGDDLRPLFEDVLAGAQVFPRWLLRKEGE